MKSKIQTFPHFDDTFSDSIEVVHLLSLTRMVQYYIISIVKKCQKYEILTKIVKAYL